MISLILIFSTTVFSFNLDKPLMLIRSLSFKDFQQQHKCHDPKLVEESSEYRDSFTATIDCTITCSNGTTKEMVIEKEFVPRNLSLYPGDGSSPKTTFWRSLGMTINTFKKQACYDAGIKKCTNLKSFKVNEIRSGDWSLKEDITCKSKNIMSPFDSRQNLKFKKVEAIFTSKAISPFGGINYEANKNELSEYLSNEKDRKKLLNKNCKRPVKVNTCFGDCIFEDDKSKDGYAETLSTIAPLGTDQFELCLDAVDINENSKELKAFKCEKIIWEFIRGEQHSGESCAAMRYSHNCSDIF